MINSSGRSGKLKNGSVAPPVFIGSPREQTNIGNATMCPSGLLSRNPRPPFRLHVKKIWINKFPDCPMCFKLDPAQFKFDPEGPLVFDVELLRNGVVLAKLGRFGPRLAVPGPVKFTMEQETSGKMMRQKANYKLRFLSTEGKILHEQIVEVEIAK